MTDVTNELMYEVLKKLQDGQQHIKLGQTEIKSELQAIRGHLNAIQGDVANLYSIVHHHDERLGRIEKRLELGSTLQ